MLSKVVVENYKSFKNRREFNLEVTKYQSLQDTNTFDGVLKGGLIVGPNATGKSTLILAIKTLLDMLFKDNYQMDFSDRCLFDKKANIHLEYQFKFSKDKISYLFESDKNGDIVLEQLIINDTPFVDRHLRSGKILIENKCVDYDGKFTEKVLLLKKCYFNDVFAQNKQIIKFMEFLRNSVYVNAFERTAISYNNISHLIQKLDEKSIQEINSTLKHINFDFFVSKSKDNLVSKVKEKNGTLYVGLKVDKPIIFLKRHDMDLNLPLEMESLGNQTLINILPSIIYATKTHSILLIDEFSSGFHNKLEEVIVKYFMLNSKNSQLIFNSHSTNLLNSRILRPDQIYTIDFEPNEGSFIERFSDENPREAQNLEKMYLSGKFGAIPNYKA